MATNKIKAKTAKAAKPAAKKPRKPTKPKASGKAAQADSSHFPIVVLGNPLTLQQLQTDGFGLQLFVNLANLQTADLELIQAFVDTLNLDPIAICKMPTGGG